MTSPVISTVPEGVHRAVLAAHSQPGSTPLADHTCGSPPVLPDVRTCRSVHWEREHSWPDAPHSDWPRCARDAVGGLRAGTLWRRVDASNGRASRAESPEQRATDHSCDAASGRHGCVFDLGRRRPRGRRRPPARPSNRTCVRRVAAARGACRSHIGCAAHRRRRDGHGRPSASRDASNALVRRHPDLGGLQISGLRAGRAAERRRRSPFARASTMSSR